MLGLIKMSALSAVLSFGVVTAYGGSVPPQGEPVSGKAFHDRIAPDGGTQAQVRFGSARSAAPVQAAAGRGVKGDRLAGVTSTACAGQEWPYIDAECLSRDDGRPKPARVRIVTIELRDGTNTSVLQRGPQTEMANR
jgi:hypothetical protein